jgi:hypothetical protein
MKRNSTSLDGSGTLARPRSAEDELARGIDITVVFTSLEGTRLAVAEADRLAAGLGAHITVLVPDVIPYHLPLDRPFLPEGFLADRLESITASCRADTRVEICMCRDPGSLLRDRLQPGSLVLVGAARRRWHWRERRLGRTLTKMGQDVLLVVPRQERRQPGPARLPAGPDDESGNAPSRTAWGGKHGANSGRRSAAW